MHAKNTQKKQYTEQIQQRVSKDHTPWPCWFHSTDPSKIKHIQVNDVRQHPEKAKDRMNFLNKGWENWTLIHD